jgi:hypothetical protein
MQKAFLQLDLDLCGFGKSLSSSVMMYFTVVSLLKAWPFDMWLLENGTMDEVLRAVSQPRPILLEPRTPLLTSGIHSIATQGD